MDNVQEMQAEFAGEQSSGADVGVQASGYLLELSLDWIVLRASENVYRLLGKSHVTLIDEPLGRFVHAQALHDLRNLFSRLSGTIGIARAYRIRLTDDTDLFDVAFQHSDGRIILEAVPSIGEGLGEDIGTVGGLIAGLSGARGQALLDGGVRRMRALTGYDRVSLICGERRAESSRGSFAAPAGGSDALPSIVADVDLPAVRVFPHDPPETSVAAALMHAVDDDSVAGLKAAGIQAILHIPFTLEDGSRAEFRCDSRTARRPNFEMHAAAELFAQLFAMRLEIDRLKS